MEKRENKRKHLRLRINVEPGNIKGFTGDLSTTGCFITTNRVLKPGSNLKIEIHHDGIVYLAGGTVRWAKRIPPRLVRHVKGGIGVEFIWKSPELSELLERLLNKPAQ